MSPVERQLLPRVPLIFQLTAAPDGGAHDIAAVCPASSPTGGETGHSDLGGFLKHDQSYLRTTLELFPPFLLEL